MERDKELSICATILSIKMSKRAISDSDEDDDGLFSFNNKIELTFDKSKLNKKNIVNQSKKLKRMQEDEDSSSSDDSEDEEYEYNDDEEDIDSSQDVLELDDTKKNSDKPPARKVNAAVERLKSFDVDLDCSLTPPPQLSSLKRSIQSASYRNVKSTLDMLKNDISSLNNSESDISLISDSQIESSAEKQKTIKLKIRLHGCITKFDVLMSDPFRNVYNLIAANENVDITKVCMNYPQENPIKYDDTPEKLGITVADIIDCYIYSGDTQYEDGEDRISIRIQGRGKKSTKDYLIGKTEKVERIFKEYCVFQNLKVKDVKFFFDGDPVAWDSTPHDLDIDDGDVIDANT